jgi:hypothetical protein
MICTLLTAAALARRPLDCRFIRQHLTRPGSDFNEKLASWFGVRKPSSRGGHIAIVEDHGEIVGWARTESWADANDWDWNTLEAFVAEPYRDRGIAAWAASALAAGPLLDVDEVAVFRPSMMMLARRVGLRCTLFRRDPEEGWVLA